MWCFILLLQPGDSSHVKKDERFLHALIAEESRKESFTAVVITGLQPEFVSFLKQDYKVWTRQLAWVHSTLAWDVCFNKTQDVCFDWFNVKKDLFCPYFSHMYHYYIHGVNGNDRSSNSADSNDGPKIDIQVRLLVFKALIVEESDFVKRSISANTIIWLFSFNQITLREKPSICPRVMSLREVEDDMETLYINAAVDKFEFKASTEDDGTVEGVIRYHPFLYDKETFPKDPNVQGIQTLKYWIFCLMIYKSAGIKLGILFWFYIYQPLMMMKMMLMSLESWIRQEGKGQYLTVSGMGGSYLTLKCLSKLIFFHYERIQCTIIIWL